MFESVQCIMYDINAKNELRPESLALFQVTRSLSSVDTPKFVGFLRLELRDILAAIDQNETQIVQSFEANILGNVCQGVLVMNVAHTRPDVAAAGVNMKMKTSSNLTALLSPEGKGASENHMLLGSPNKKILPPIV